MGTLTVTVDWTDPVHFDVDLEAGEPLEPAVERAVALEATVVGDELCIVARLTHQTPGTSRALPQAKVS